MPLEIPSYIYTVLVFVIPFAIGIVVGRLARILLKYVLLLIAVIVLASYVGVEKYPPGKGLLRQAMEGLPHALGFARSYFGFLPIASAPFIVGVAVGFWKG